MSDFGSRLKNIRKNKNITQKELAKNIKVAQSTIANYEKNLRFPGSEILRQLSDELDISVDYLLGLTELEVKDSLDSEYDLESVYTHLLDILLLGKTQEAREIIKSFAKRGFSSIDIIEYIFMPLLRLIGDKWVKDEISIGQEHYITGLIDRLFDFISEENKVEEDKKMTALFMAPTGEEHVISLKMSTEYFRVRGWKVIFLGRSIPIKSLIEIIKNNKVDLVVLSAITQSSINSASYIVEGLKWNLKETSPKFLLGGNIVDESNQRVIDTFIDYPLSSIYNLKPLVKKIEEDILNG